MTKKKTTIKVAKGKTTVKHPDGSIEQEEEKVSSKEYEGQVCNVGFSLAHTMNLGNYESLRVEVSLHMPVYAHEIDWAHEFGSKWVEDKMEAKIDNYKKDLGDK